MCVILISNPEAKRLDENHVLDAYMCNQDGIGAAWLEDGKVCWRKGISITDAVTLANTLPQPYMFHFRLATIGQTIPELTHPFPMFGDIDEDLEGHTIHGVLMHNGHWGSWEREFKIHANAWWITEYLRTKERWSDSRGMAFLASRLGYHVLPKIANTGQRIAVMTRRGITTYGAGWDTLDDNTGIIASNKWFQCSTGGGRWWDDDYWPGGYAGYAGYLYRTRRRFSNSTDPGTDQIGHIQTVEYDPTAVRDAKGEVIEGFVYPSESHHSKRLGDLTESEWLERERLLADEEEDWENFNRIMNRHRGD